MVEIIYLNWIYIYIYIPIYISRSDIIFSSFLFNQDINLPNVCCYLLIGHRFQISTTWILNKFTKGLKKILESKMCACKHLQNIHKIHEHSFFIPFISKNDYDKPKVKK